MINGESDRKKKKKAKRPMWRKIVAEVVIGGGSYEPSVPYRLNTERCFGARYVCVVSGWAKHATQAEVWAGPYKKLSKNTLIYKKRISAEAEHASGCQAGMLAAHNAQAALHKTVKQAIVNSARPFIAIKTMWQPDVTTHYSTEGWASETRLADWRDKAMGFL